ncbi:MAG: hypothetical protein KDA84_07250, partial [Planctomycetaceae bacterium]|nr:hypothetical protein [Planctomycetaceae bacterium]
SPAVPTAHRTILSALGQTRKLNYKKQTIDTCMKDLSKSLGIKIQVHESVMKIGQPERVIDFETEEPVSHQTAIRLVMQQFGFYEYGLVFGDKQLTIVHGSEYPGTFLCTYSLMSRSDFSIAERERWMQSTRNEVFSDTWGVENKTWIQPGESIFEVAIYQTQKVQTEIRKRM